MQTLRSLASILLVTLGLAATVPLLPACTSPDTSSPQRTSATKSKRKAKTKAKGKRSKKKNKSPANPWMDPWNVTYGDRERLPGPVGVRAGYEWREATVADFGWHTSWSIAPQTSAVHIEVSTIAPRQGCEAMATVRWRHPRGMKEIRETIQVTAKVPTAWKELRLNAPPAATTSQLELILEAPADCKAKAAFTDPSVASARADARANIVLLLLDTVRRDHFDCERTTSKLTPTIASLCSRGTFFSEAVASSGWTYPSIASMFTGLLPSEHGGMRSASNGRRDLRPEVTTAAQLLRASGYRTTASVGNWNGGRGLWRGFERFRQRWPNKGDNDDPRRANTMVESALELIDDAKAFAPNAPWLSWVLFMDAHEPVDAASIEKRMPAECNGVEPVPFRWQGLADPPDPIPPVLERAMSCRRALYREALRSIDDAIAVLVDGLRKRGELDNTALIVVSDHGEEFWEHARSVRGVPKRSRGVGHGHSLHAELTDVPLLVVPPAARGAKARRLDGLVSVRDVFATLLGFAAVTPPSGRGALDLSVVATGSPLNARDWVISESTLYGPDRVAITTADLRALRTGRHGLIFDRAKDRGEQRPLAGKGEAGEADLYRKGQRLLRRVFDGDRDARASDDSLSEDDEAALRALGYVQSGPRQGSPPSERGKAARTPKQP